jgi:processive 1,2-diacylglycerol beta-glucosyltransferase
MAAADVVVTKSGGLTVSECLAVGRPVLVVRPTPGQEERNSDFLLENGAGLKAVAPEILRWKLARLWNDPDRLAGLARTARALARPNAARDIAKVVLAG